jgi:predicted transcriptional regulator
MLAVRLPAKLEKRLDRLAKRTGRTKPTTRAKPSYNTWTILKTSTSQRRQWKKYAQDGVNLFRLKK